MFTAIAVTLDIDDGLVPSSSSSGNVWLWGEEGWSRTDGGMYQSEVELATTVGGGWLTATKDGQETAWKSECVLASSSGMGSSTVNEWDAAARLLYSCRAESRRRMGQAFLRTQFYYLFHRHPREQWRNLFLHGV